MTELSADEQHMYMAVFARTIEAMFKTLNPHEHQQLKEIITTGTLKNCPDEKIEDTIITIGMEYSTCLAAALSSPSFLAIIKHEVDKYKSGVLRAKEAYYNG